MSLKYDSKTTEFSPEGRLYQVEYAIEAISHAGVVIGLISKNGIIIAAEKRIASKLIDFNNNAEKMYRIDSHIVCAVAGLQADAKFILNYARKFALRYKYQYQENIPVEQLVKSICDLKQGYTQFGGYRPFGVSLIIAGWDSKKGYQLYDTDPSGNYSGWKACAIGSNKNTVFSIFKSDYKEDIELQKGLHLTTKAICKAMETFAPTSKRIEFSTFIETDGKIKWKVYKNEEVDSAIKEAKEEYKSEFSEVNE